MAKVGSSKGRHGVTLEYLSQKWLISPQADMKKVQHTTQQGIRKILHPYLLQQFKTNELDLRYNRLQHSAFNSTIQAGTVLRRGNWYAQVYSSGFGWSREHPTKRKGYVHR